MSDRPNVVLVHGAWADGSCWSGVIERLQAAGYTVTAPQFALGLDRRRRRQAAARAVAAERADRGRRALVRRADHHVARRRRAERRRRSSTSRPSGSTRASRSAHCSARARRRRRWRTSTSTSSASRGCPRRTSSGTSQPTSIRHEGARHVRGAAAARTVALGDVMGAPAWKSLPSWFLVAQNDEAIPPDAERLFACAWARPPSRWRRATWRWCRSRTRSCS